MPDGKTGRLIVHVGDHKTGSTSIQQTLATGRLSIAGKTLFYPSRFNHNYLVGEIARAGDPAESSLPTLMTRVARAAADVTILSAEEFESMAPTRMRKLRDRYFAQVSDEVVYVCYLRPHAARIVSECAERFKVGFFQGDLEGLFQQIYRNGGFHYAPRIKDWRKEFGEDYILRPMIRSELKNGNVVEDFFHAALQGQRFSIAARRLANESLGLRDLMLLKLIHRFTQGHSNPKRLHLGGVIAQFLQTQAGEAQDKLRMHRALAEQVAKAYRADAKAVDDAMFGGRPLLQAELDRAVDTAIPEPQSLEPEDYFSPTARRDIEALAKSINILMGVNGVAPHLFEARVKALHEGSSHIKGR